MEFRLLGIRSISYKKKKTKNKALVFSQGRKDLDLIWNVSVSQRELRGI